MIHDSGNRSLHVTPDIAERAGRFLIARIPRAFLQAVDRLEGPIHRSEDLPQGDLIRRFCQRITAAHTALAVEETGSLERKEELLQIPDRKALSLGYSLDRDRSRTVVESEVLQRPGGVISPG